MSQLPAPFVLHLRDLAEASAWGIGTHRAHFLKHLDRWRRNPKTTLPLPGYLTPPRNAPGLNHPPGWSRSNFERIAKEHRLRRLCRS
jgi:hypothetical protein